MPGPAFLRGEGIELRTIEEDDLDFLQSTMNDPTVRRYLGSRSPINGQQEQEWFEERASDTDKDHVHLLICRDEGAMGSISLYPKDPTGVNAEIGISLAEEFWGNGYGTEAARLITDFGFRERRHHRIIARVFEGNVGSARIWEKLGFRHEATHVESAFLDGEYVNVEFFAVLEDEWFGRGE